MNASVPQRVAVLDALRAFAVAGVIGVHYPGLVVGDYIDTGTLGVRLFFVLSGFLITGLLLRDRRLIETGELSASRAVRDFFVRRLLRIAPAYYLALGAAWLVAMNDIRSSWPWHAAFLSNQQIIALGHWPGSLSHLWTLALEFQFYLAWPWALLFLPRRLFPSMIAVCLVIGPASRWASPEWGVPASLAHLVTTGSLDFFAWGAAVAWYRDRDRLSAPRLDRIGGLLLPGLLLASIVLAARLPWSFPVHRLHAFAGIVMGAAFAALLAVCTRPEPPRWAVWLGSRRWLVRMGVVSYGIYLYHNLMHWVAPRACLRLFGNSYPSQPLLYTGVMFVALSVLTFASWRFMEAPLNRLARRLTTSR